NSIPVVAGATPNGAKGRIVLAAPALSGVSTSTNRIIDLGLQGWLYAVVVTPNDHFDGLYLTKDFGQNWTKVRIPTLPKPGYGTPTNDNTRADYDVFGNPTEPFAQGNYD